MLQLISKNLLVVGIGKSGLSVAKRAKELGAHVWTYEDKSEARGKRRGARGFKEFQHFELPTPNSRLPTPNFDLVVTSPGILFNHQVFKLATERGWPIISEIEFAYLLIKPKFVIAVTGTNGKTTVVEMLRNVFKFSGRPYTVAGNIGTPLSSLSKIEGTLILELSSFQLHFIDQFRANIAIFLNIEQDHLDWHCCFGQYLKDKLRLLENQKKDDVAVINADTYVGKQSLPELINDMGTLLKPKRPAHCGARLNSKNVPDYKKVEKGRGLSPLRLNGDCPQKVVSFSTKSSADYCLKDGYLTAFGKKIMPAKDIQIKGLHNLANALAVIACAKEVGLDAEAITNGLKSFKGLDHRLQFVAQKKGISFYNDSKSTNPDSTRKAIGAFKQPPVLIMGGRNKGNDFSFLKDYIDSGIKQLVLFGEAANEIKEQAGIGYITKTVEQALIKAVQLAQPKSVILFSPGCASFDLFENYARRGEAFIKAVQEL